MDENQVIWQELRTKQNHLDLLDERNRSIRQQREEQFETFSKTEPIVAYDGRKVPDDPAYPGASGRGYY